MEPRGRRQGGAWYEEGGELWWWGLGHLKTSEVGAVLERTVRRFERHLRRRGLLRLDEDDADPDLPGDPENNLAASAVSGQTPPGGAAVGEGPGSARATAARLRQAAVRFAVWVHVARGDSCRSAGLGGARGALCYVLRPPIGQERLEHRPDGCVHIILKKAFRASVDT